MSTDFFLACGMCVKKQDHIHRSENRHRLPDFHRFFGGSKRGVVLQENAYKAHPTNTFSHGSICQKLPDDTMLIEHDVSVVRRSDLVRLGDLRAQVGEGKIE